MAEEREPFRQKLLIVFLQSFVFAAGLAILGYYLSDRLETHKQALANQSERTKILMTALEPNIQQRRAAYVEFQKAAREAKYELDVYYFRTKEPREEGIRRDRLSSPRNELGIGSGGSGSTWSTHHDAVAVVERLVDLRETYEDVSSNEVSSAVDEFIDTILHDLRESAKKSNDNEAFHASARAHLRTAFAKLSEKIESALGLDQMPIR